MSENMITQLTEAFEFWYGLDKRPAIVGEIGELGLHHLAVLAWGAKRYRLLLESGEASVIPVREEPK